MSHPEMMIAEDYYRAVVRENAELRVEILQLRLELAALTEKEPKHAD